MVDFILSLVWASLVVLALGTLVYIAYTLAPRIAHFVKTFINWHFHD